MTRNRRCFVRIAVLAGLVWSNLAVQAGAAELIRLNPGYVSLLKLNQTISTIVIGNPDVVDATLQGKNEILLTAKRVTGSVATNVIVLNSQDAEIFNATIVVGSQGGAKTEIHSKGRSGGLHEYWAYRCMPTCERVEDKLETFQRAATPATPAPVTAPPPSEPSEIPSNPNVPQY
jgi:hypothetical protein